MTDLGQRTVLDLFAGPGGWSEGLRMHGLTELGIEWDEAACATARAAGHERLQADVAALDPVGYPCWGLIASPPCQAWSMAGKGGGRRDVEHVIACALEVAAGGDTRAEHAEKCEDARSLLVVEPLRWAQTLEPEWIALEQVPPVLELWTLFAQIIEAWGYSTWAGVLEAERYGVPQTRERAVLMASKAKTVHPPIATHQRYVPGQPQRRDVTLEGEVMPWVSMAEALGWQVENLALRAGTNANDAIRPITTPAPTLRFGARMNTVSWIVDTGNTRSGSRKEGRWRPTDEPAPVVTSRSDQLEWRDSRPPSTAALQAEGWPYTRPATTIAGDARVFQPGGHHTDGAQSENSVRVSIAEASVLQSFSADYPWHGTATKVREQIGNAVPPLLAHAVLGQLIDPATSQEARRAA